MQHERSSRNDEPVRAGTGTPERRSSRLPSGWSALKTVTRDFIAICGFSPIPKNCGPGARSFITGTAVCCGRTERYPLVIFAGDVGTGKTVTAEGACDRLAREAKREAMLFKLSTRVRGSGKVGQMSTLLNEAFEVVAKQAGKTRQAFLIIDEADSLASTPGNRQSHHEDKVAVNTIIQKVDDLRRHSGRILVFLCTNREARWTRPLCAGPHGPRFDRPNDS